jgi:hypothetical protein
MDPTTSLIIIIAVTLTTRYLLTIGMVWLAKEKDPPVRISAAILWTAVIIVAFWFLLGSRGRNIAIIATIWHYLVIWFARQENKNDAAKR